MYSRNVSAKNGLYARGDASLPEDFIWSYHIVCVVWVILLLTWDISVYFTMPTTSFSHIFTIANSWRLESTSIFCVNDVMYIALWRHLPPSIFNIWRCWVGRGWGEGGVDSPGKGLTTHILGRDLGKWKISWRETVYFSWLVLMKHYSSNLVKGCWILLPFCQEFGRFSWLKYTF